MNGRWQRLLQLACVATLSCVMPPIADAHRLDEYLQATRVSIDTERIVVELNLTPGADVAEGVIAEIDRDGNGELSVLESDAYARKFVRSLLLEIDGTERSLSLEQYRFPSPADMRQGLGIIRVSASARAASVLAGPHRLVFRNNHRSDIGVYLVNALLPSDQRIKIHNQSRDFFQREYAVDYTIEPLGNSGRAASVSAIGLGLAAFVYVFARRHGLSIGG